MQTTVFRPTRLEIDLDNLSSNIQEARKFLRGGTLFMAVVKADAYGHGAVESARLFLRNGADWLGVATPSEALELRNAYIDAPVLVLGYTAEDQFSQLIDTSIRPTIYDVGQARALSRVASGASKIVPIHVKVDTGLSRIGFLPTDESVSDIVTISRMEGLNVEGIFTHFASSGDKDKSFTKKQFERFMWVVDRLEGEGVGIPLKHCSNSSAVVELPEYHLSMVRAGTILYGLDSYKRKRKKIFLPAMTLKSKLSHVKTVEAGTGIGYGSTFITTRTSRIGTIPIGYADGYRSANSRKGYVKVGGSRAPIIGSIAMDQMMVDLTEVNGVKMGDDVTLFGYAKNGAPNIAEFAKWDRSFSHETACSISRRVPRVYYSGGKAVKIVDYVLNSKPI